MCLQLYARWISGRDLVTRFGRDESGNYIIITALLMPVLVGVVGLGTDYGLWSHTHRLMQSAADSGAVSAATAYAMGNTGGLATQANAVASSYGFVNGQNGVSIAVNRPPLSGNNTKNQKAIEVIIRQPSSAFFSAVLQPQQFDITARSVAIGNGDGKGCVLALNGTASGASTTQGGAQVDLKNCSLYNNSADASAMSVGGSGTVKALSVNVVGGISGQSGITTTQGSWTGVSPASDPYADVTNPTPTGPLINSCCSHGTETLSPGIYKNGMKLVAGANITLSPGVYYIGGSGGGSGLDVAGGATLSGTNVTLVFTSINGGNYADATINGGATINLTAPTTGPYAGIAMFGDRNMPTGTNFTFNGGSSQSFTGALYLPKGNTKFAGGNDSSSGCTQLITDTITFTGNSNLAIDCAGKGTKPLALANIALVE
jgi:Flp pilus assembly protein TadG